MKQVLACSVFSFFFDKRNTTVGKVAGCLIVSVLTALCQEFITCQCIGIVLMGKQKII
mgnify:CR=1 FL=1